MSRFRQSRHSLKLQERGKKNILKETSRTAVKVLGDYTEVLSWKMHFECWIAAALWCGSWEGTACLGMAIAACCVGSGIMVLLEKTLWDQFSAHLAHLQCFSGVTPRWGKTEPSSELLIGHQMLPGSWTTSLCGFVWQQHIHKTDSSSCGGKILPLCVFIVLSSLKHTQLLVFMFLYYCIICLGKSCRFIHLQILNVNSLNFYIPP